MTTRVDLNYAPLLTEDEPAVVEVVNPMGQAPMVILCEHASNRIPRCLNNLGVDDEVLGHHVAWDIGIANLARRLSSSFDAPAVLANYSRLVIDLNRHLDDETSIPLQSDGVVIPGNQGLMAEQVEQRIETFFYPYHAAVSSVLDGVVRRDKIPLVVSLHSFTPVIGGISRPWNVGVLWHNDDRVAFPLIQRLRAVPGLCVGDNEPYHAKEPVGYSMEIHAERHGFPHALLEIRQNEISSVIGQERWAGLLHTAFTDILADKKILTPLENDSGTNHP